MIAKFSRSFVFAALLLAGCAHQASTGAAPPPAPAPIVVANSVLALADAVNGAAQSVIACRQQSKCSAEDVNAMEAVITAIANTGKQVDTEMRSTDSWNMQKQAILKIISASGLAQLKTKVSPAGQALIVSVVTLLDQISAAVGGPQI